MCSRFIFVLIKGLGKLNNSIWIMNINTTNILSFIYIKKIIPEIFCPVIEYKTTIYKNVKHLSEIIHYIAHTHYISSMFRK